MQRRGLLVLAMTIALVSVVAVPAVADHEYSHRYYVIGRVVDTDGNPLQGVQVEVTFDGAGQSFEGECPGAHPPTSSPVTDAVGKYLICKHLHSVPDQGVEVVISPQGGETVRRAIDADHRRTIQHFQLDGSTGSVGDVESFSSSLTLRGFAWRPNDDVRVAGQSVNGVMLKEHPVSLEVTFPDGSTAEADATTDGYGDYEVVLEDVPADIEGTEVTVSSVDSISGDTVERTRTLGSEEALYRYQGTGLVFPERPTDLSWLYWVGGLALAGALAYGGYRAWAKRQEQREVQKAREQSTRKRANK